MRDADKEIKSADAAIDPLLVAAKITTIEVNGKPTPATSETVPLALKITAYAGTVKAGAGDAEVSQMAANNNVLAEQAKTLEQRAITAETNLAAATREKISLDGQLTVEKASVARLNAENAELLVLRKAANTEAGRVTEQLNGVNADISRRCLAIGCLVDLRNEKNELLASTATADEKQAAAERIPIAEKLNMFNGAVNSTLNKLGVNVASLPSQPGTGTAATKPAEPGEGLTGLDRAIAVHRSMHKKA